MSAPENERILRLLASISDGAEVDWEREERDSADDEERQLIRSVRIVAGISRFHDAPRAGSRLAPGTLLGHLVIGDRIGGGTSGDVYRATDTRLEREVAVKVLGAGAAAGPGRPRWARSYLEEARRLARVRHPNVVTVHSAEVLPDGPGRGGVALVLEHVAGETLAALVQSQGRRGAHEIVAIGSDLCRAVAAVHAAGLLHQDIKAQNVMREDGGRIVLMDFGPAGATPLYMAPELFRGDGASIQSDLYSVGVLLYHLATGAFPVTGGDLEGLKEAHARHGAVRLSDRRPDFPADLTRVIERALEPDPQKRFASAGEMEHALAACLASPSAVPSFPPSGPLPAGGRGSEAAGKARRVPALAWVAAAAVAVALGAGALWIAGRGPDERKPDPSPVHRAGSGAPYTIEAAVFSGHSQKRPLAEGDRIAPGDSISITLRASEDLHVYVIEEDDQGEAYLLFPVPGFESTNPLAAGITHVLPGRRDGREVYWQVTSPGGKERLLLLASAHRLESIEAAVADLPLPRKDSPLRYAPIAADRIAGELRGIGGVVEVERSAANETARRGLFEMAEVLPRGPEEARGVWIRCLVLENPVR